MRAQEQKAKQRHKEYEKKREAKARDRQMYHLRHTRDYEALELPIGASRAEVKVAYRKLAKARRSLFCMPCFRSVLKQMAVPTVLPSSQCQ